MEVIVREYAPGDKNFLYSTMLRGLYYGNEFFNLIDKSTFFKRYPPVIEQMLLNPANKAAVACLADDPEVLLAWVLYTPGPANEVILHFAFTKAAFRKQGLITKLLENKNIMSVSHLTELGNSIRLKKNIPFNPFL